MANLRHSLENAENQTGERIEAIVVGQHDRERWNGPAPRQDECVILSRDAGLAKLDQDYNDGYGSADCHPFWAWTRSRVYFVAEYDGATGVAWVPRNPLAGSPGFSGGEA